MTQPPASTGEVERRPWSAKGGRVKAAALVGSVLGVLAALAPQSFIAARPPVTSPSEVYAALQRDAQHGDKRATEMLAAVDAYAKQAGISIEAMGPLGPGRTETKATGLMRIRVEDHAPWAVAIRNVTELRSKSDQAAYVALRTGALRQMAVSTPNRKLRVIVTPNRLVGLDAFVSGLECSCTVTEVVVDVFVGGEWAFSSLRGVHAPPGHKIAEDLLAQAEEAAAAHVPGSTRGQLLLTVRRVSLTATAMEARHLSDRPDVLLVDALDDLGDAYRGRAAQVDVTGAPDVFFGHAKWNLGVALEASPSSPGANGGKP